MELFEVTEEQYVALVELFPGCSVDVFGNGLDQTVSILITKRA